MIMKAIAHRPRVLVDLDWHPHRVNLAESPAF